MPTPGTVEYPTALDSVVSLFEVGNRAFTTLRADMNNSVLTVPLTDSSTLPSTGVVTLTDSLTAPTKHEEIIFTANAANDLTVPVGGRGAFGSSAQNWSGTVYVRMRMIAEHHEVLRDAVIQLETKLGYGSATPTNGKFLVGNTTAGTSTWRVLAAGDIPDLSATYEPANANIQAHIASTSNPHSVTKSQVGLGNVENTALSTWAGSANLATLGTIASGTWNGSVIGSDYGGAGSINGILKANGSGVVSAASAGTDYLGVTAPGSSGQLLYNNANAYAAVAGSVYSASADHSLKFTPTVSKAGLLIYEPTSTAPATVVGAPALLQLHTVDDISYWQLSYSSDAINDVWANYLYSDGGIWFSHSNGTDTGYFAMWRNGFATTSISSTQYGGIGEVADNQFGLMLTTATPSSGAVFPLTWRTTGITQAVPATALADGSVPVNHLHFYQDEATNELKAKWKESGGSVNTITFGGGASNPFDDATAILKGSADATKLLRIEVDGLTTATTRVWTAPDANLTVAGIDLAQTWTANQTFGSGILRATSPQITTGINDSNGASLIAVTATGSAIFGMTLANAASGGTVAIGVTTPTQGASAIAGTPLSITASAAVAGNVNVGAAAGGSVTITAGAAARNTSGNANGGAVVLVDGAGIGTGVRGGFNFGGTASSDVKLLKFSNGYGAASLVMQAGDGAASLGSFHSGTMSVSILTSSVEISMVGASGGRITIAGGHFGFASNAGGRDVSSLDGARDCGLTRQAASAMRVTNGSTGAGSLVLGTSTVGSIGTSGVGVLAIANGTAPSSSPADEFQLYSADWNGAGTAAAHFRNEEGHIIKIARAATYTPTNVSTDRSYDANATTLDELADVVGTLIADLQTLGFLG